MVETGDTVGAGGGLAAAIIALVVLILLFFGFTRWNWFGSVPSQTAPPQQSTSVSSPASLPSGGSSPMASPSK